MDGVQRALRRGVRRGARSRSTASPTRSTRSRRRGLATCVASSGDLGKIRRNLAKTGLLGRFDGRLFSADDVEHGKPAPDLFLHAAAAMGFEPARGRAVVEDSVHGVVAGLAAGMAVFAYAGRRDARLPAPRARRDTVRPDRLAEPDRVLSSAIGPWEISSRNVASSAVAAWPAGASTISVWPSDQSVSVVRKTMITASGTSPPSTDPGRVPRVLHVEPRGRPTRPSMWPPTTAAIWIVQTRPGGRNACVGSKNAQPNPPRSQPCWSGSARATMIRWPSMNRYVK